MKNVLITNILRFTNSEKSLKNFEGAAMAKIAIAKGYDVYAADWDTDGPFDFIKPWNGEFIDIVFFHCTPGNFFGGIQLDPKTHTYRLHQQLSEIIYLFNPEIWFLEIDTRLTHSFFMKSMRTKGRNNEPLRIVIEYLQKNDPKLIGYLPTADEKWPIYSQQLALTKEVLGGPAKKTVPMIYIGSKRKDRVVPDFPDNCSVYGGIDQVSRCKQFKSAWKEMAKASSHVILRDKEMRQVPNHRYLQSLILDAVPILAFDDGDINYVHSPILREEGKRLDAWQRQQELLPEIQKEWDYWIKYDLDYCWS